jgi:hypothetical protein
MATREKNDEWTKWWDARLAALESILGRSDETVGHAPVPFELGADAGGAADILFFKNHLKGIVSVTAELIGQDEQIRNELGNYELMICHRDDEEWGPNLISRLAYYTLETRLDPGDTMDIGETVPEGSTIAGLLFFGYANFKVLRRNAGLLLCVGITAEELEACQNGKRRQVEKKLKTEAVYPFTDLYRMSIIR